MMLRSLALGLVTCVSPWATARAETPETVCHDSPGHLIVEGATGEVGTHFLIKYKSAQAPAPRCAYVKEAGDFELRNEDAEYFLGQSGDLLILDSGTGPDPRGLIIWDLGKRTKVYTGRYSDATVETTGMTYWVESGEATDANCPEAKEWREGGLGAAMETRVRLEFADFSVHRSTETRCSSRQ